jgi:hypothetical protein
MQVRMRIILYTTWWDNMKLRILMQKYSLVYAVFENSQNDVKVTYNRKHMQQCVQGGIKMRYI